MKNIRDYFIGNEKGAAILYRYVGVHVAFLLQKTPLSPNQLTIIGFISGLFAALFFAQGSQQSLIWGAICYQACIILDYSDGTLARLKGMTSYTGRWLEYCLDAIREFFIIFGICWGVYGLTHDHVVWVLGFVLIGTNFIMDTEEQCFLTFPFASQGIRAFAPQSKLYEISKHVISIRTTRYLAILLFVFMDIMYIFLIFFTLYNTVILLLMTFILGRKVYAQDVLKTQADQRNNNKAE